MGGRDARCGGNQTAINGVPSGIKYDAENRMVQETSAGPAISTYSYDGEGRRVQRASGGVTTQYVYDANGELAAEYSSAPSASGTKIPVEDALGSIRGELNTSGTFDECYDFLPFGETLTGFGRTSACFTPASSATAMKFTGKEQDAETGLDYFGARYMSSAQGRFTSPDPMVHPSQSQLGEEGFLVEPQRWNKYAYAVNNPLTYNPDGAEAAVFLIPGQGAWSPITGQYLPRQSNPDMLRTAAIPVLGMAAAATAEVAPELGLLAVGRAAFNWLLSHPQQVQGTAAGIAEGASGAPPGALTSSLANLGATTAESVERKLSQYLLNADHAVGGTKA